jgi:hypothetical protein
MHVPAKVTLVLGATSPLHDGPPPLPEILNELSAKENEQPPLEARQPLAKLPLTNEPVLRVIDP